MIVQSLFFVPYKEKIHQIQSHSQEDLEYPFIFLNILFRKIYDFQNKVAWALWKFSNSQTRGDILILAWQMTGDLLWM